MPDKNLRRIAIVGGSRIPFCRSGTLYADQTNMDMLTAAFQGVVDRYNLSGKKLDQVIAGAVTTHSKDWNLAREAVLSTDLSPLTPAVTMQQACGTSLQAAILAGSQIASGEIECALVGGTDTTSDVPIVFKRRFAQRLMQLNKAKTFGQRLKAFKGFSFSELAPQPPRNSEPRTGLSMGQHCERMAREWNITRKEQDDLALESHHKAAEAWDSGFFDDLVKPHNGVLRDNIVRPDTTMEKLSSLKPAFDRSKHGTLTAGNSTTLSDGAAAVLLASEDWVRKHDLPVLAWLTHSRTAAVDFVDGDEGLLMAPTVAVAEMLQQAGLKLQDFDFYEIHEAFAAQVLCTLKAWESEIYCTERLGLDGPLGSIDRSRMNVHGGSVAMGHPFAATGARIVATLAHILEKAGSGRGLISICTAGGMGVSAILERDNNGSGGGTSKKTTRKKSPKKKGAKKSGKKKTATKTSPSAAPGDESTGARED
ncbi:MULTISPECIES: acetyl-CoA C-acetyltransferase [unclassified Wenzhouxiangella]|uniref:acetyl-CoA C-acetyltransferase n=1 Tax=unclassified Wenzhouxiangella TaxID=2613841 RepID=UPI000E326F81|nr:MULTISPECIES: acetyl-CoA C-acetyltransferase [unclassified Wenzhouxiangella]RFF27957.1 acetyl-CoA C-acetyltransferase [Wenzhouxiangella sp. 15181]RFP68544.1 acetyl-CoA C-acetyltransferase [Wenzhouxiangella sp. 15190]